MAYIVVAILKVVTSWSPSPAAPFLVFEDGAILQVFMCEALFIRL